MSKLAVFLPPDLEVRSNLLMAELDSLTAKAATAKDKTLTRAESKRADAIIAELATIRQTARHSAETRSARVEAVQQEFAAAQYAQRAAHTAAFKAFLRGQEITHELRANMLAGTNTVTYTAGPQGGISVPVGFQEAITRGLAAVDPLLDPNVSTVIQEDDFSLQPRVLPGWDLSTVQAVKVGEAVQQGTSVVPPVTQKLVNKWTYRLSLGASLEFEEDQFLNTMETMGLAFGIGFARGIGIDTVSGNGSDAPSGILNGLPTSYTTTNSGKVVLDDITSVYFSVNSIYRKMPKCAWLFSDASYQQVRNAVDGNGRPLINVVDDRELLMGKPIYISPTLPAYNPSLGTQATGSFCVFGNIGQYIIHNSTMFLRRRTQLPGYVEAGLALFTGLQMTDAVLHDPTNGAMPPVVAAALHS
jgi:HK97 family phage major capsid protein